MNSDVQVVMAYVLVFGMSSLTVMLEVLDVVFAAVECKFGGLKYLLVGLGPSGHE